MPSNPSNPMGTSIRCNEKFLVASDIASNCSKDDIDVSGNLVHEHNPSCSRLHNPDDNNNQCIILKIDNDLIHIEACSCIADDRLNVESLKLELACLYYLQLPMEKRSKALYSLNIENCSITSRTIQKVADALGAESAPAQLCTGYNNSVTGNALTNLFVKLAALNSFSELNLNGLKLSKLVVDNLCRLPKTSCLTQLMLGSTGIGTDGAVQLIESFFSGTQESVKHDLSYCGLAPICILNLATNVSLIHGILELNLGGNPIMQEGGNALVSMLTNPQCCLKVLVLNKCQLGLAGVLQLIQALAENDTLEELNAADNTDMDKQLALHCDLTSNPSTELLPPKLNTSEFSDKECVSKEVGTDQQDLCPMNTECNQLEVADREDDLLKAENVASMLDDSCTSSCQKNSSFMFQFTLELSTAISMAKRLQQLDLSNNGLSSQAVETIYSMWSSRSGATPAWKHITERTVYFSFEGNKCCKEKPCCRRN